MPKYIWPVPEGMGISQSFGSSPGGFNPVGGHTGTDFLTPMWTPIRAIADGVVKQAGWLAGSYADNPWWLEPSFAGIVVAIDHGPLVSIYAHLIETELNPGDRVRQGDVIGYSGNTRNGELTFGPHLHFETIPDGWSFSDGTYGRRDPARYCTGYWSGTSTQGDKPTPISPSTEEGFLMALTDAEQKLALALLKQIAGYTDMKTSEVPRKVWGWNPHKDRTDMHGRLTELWRDFQQGVAGKNVDGDSFGLLRGIAAKLGVPIDETARRKKVTGK